MTASLTLPLKEKRLTVVGDEDHDGLSYKIEIVAKLTLTIAVSAGQTVLDLTITVPPTMSVHNSHAVEQRVREAIMNVRREVREVKIHVHGLEENEMIGQAGKSVEGTSNVPKSDFGREGC
uniref:Cation efflux protein cytoplasmic domain-containing protein n=1 Tax=Kwoniella pini CBS 10737 TaxID=1296096 RepID=A0A1B9HU59_9TREE|nr:uncharacterized protein I206_07190 [Kwoniella pini CBS 10737]OCF46803.1 hypothetical protein I206_07190 [Kwoniella pini CBS 10737]